MDGQSGVVVVLLNGQKLRRAHVYGVYRVHIHEIFLHAHRTSHQIHRHMCLFSAIWESAADEIVVKQRGVH